MITVTCDFHGEQKPAYLCQHILDKKGIGFYTAGPRSFAAWCVQCEDLFQREKGWTKKASAFAAFGVVCRPCFRYIKQDQEEQMLLLSN